MICSIYYVKCDLCGATGPEVGGEIDFHNAGRAVTKAAEIGWVREPPDWVQKCPVCVAKSRKYATGDRVKHSWFGDGTVRCDYDDSKSVEVAFDSGSTIQAIRANLTPIDLTKGK